MHSVGVLFKQLLSNRDFCLRDPSDLVPFPLNSEEIDQTMRALLSFSPDESNTIVITSHLMTVLSSGRNSRVCPICSTRSGTTRSGESSMSR